MDINTKYGKLTILEKCEPPKESLDKQKKYKKWFKCRCDCGNETVAYLSQLKSGQRKGCKHCSHPHGKNSPFFQGYEQISKRYYTHIKRTACGGTNKRKRIGKDFKVSIEFLWNLYLKQNKKCALSGVPLYFHSRSEKNDGNISLDRIDSNKGYTEDNVQWVHKNINIMKSVFSQNEFIELCKKVVFFNKDK